MTQEVPGSNPVTSQFLFHLSSLSVKLCRLVSWHHMYGGVEWCQIVLNGVKLETLDLTGANNISNITIAIFVSKHYAE